MLVGGRLVHLQSCITLLQKLECNSDDQCESIKTALFSRKLKAQKASIIELKPESERIIEELSVQTWKCGSWRDDEKC